MARVHRIGEPENRSEAKAIRHLAEVLPDNYFIFHNFELTSGGGLPYKYDIAVVGDFAVWHVEVKGYHGRIRGDQNQWKFTNGGTIPSPIPLANKKSKILAGKLRQHARALDPVFVDTVVLLTDDKALVRVRDDQASRIIRLEEAHERFTNPSHLPVRSSNIEPLQNEICRALFGARPSHRVTRIGLYDVVERLRQDEWRTVFLANHRYIRTQPKTVLKVFHFDVYAKPGERDRQIESIFHDQNALRMMSGHPNVIRTGDMFAWEDDKFVLPMEYVDGARPVRDRLEEGRAGEVPWARKALGILKSAEGLRHAHECGVIHRDLRPMNVIVAPPATLKIVNFDLALIRDNPAVVRPRHFMKRIDRRYVAPEVFDDPDCATEASDIYSLGIIFYEIIVGRWPYDDIEAVIASRSETPLDRDALLSGLSTSESVNFMGAPEEAAQVIAKMCRQDPAARYRRMDDVMSDLAILAEG